MRRIKKVIAVQIDQTPISIEAKCQVCIFFKQDVHLSQVPGHDAFADVPGAGGDCHRYPKVEHKYCGSWCGEFIPDKETMLTGQGAE